MDEQYLTLHSKLELVAVQAATKCALQIKKDSGYKQITYSELVAQAKHLAHCFVACGIKPQAKIAIVLENCPEWVIIYFAILFVGATAVPLDPQSAMEDLGYLFNNSDSQLLFTSMQYLERIMEVKEQLDTLREIIVIDASAATIYNSIKITPYTNFVTAMVETALLPTVSTNSIASILYTSGTTGKPKGVMLTHQNFYADFRSAEKIKLITGGHNIVAILPFHHSFPFMATLILPLFTANTITFAPSLKSDELLACMRETGVTALGGVPQLFVLFYKHIFDNLQKLPWFARCGIVVLTNICWWLRRATKINLAKIVFKKVHQPFGAKLRFFVTGGAKLNPEVELFLVKFGFTLLQGYGLTETAPAVTFNNLYHEKIGSAGRALPDVEIKINAPDSKGIGEVLIRGPNVMLGYYKNPEATKEVLQNSWFHSGDLGYLDKSRYLFIVGRKKEIIVLSSGKNISPEEVEAHYGASKHIKELCVLSLGEGAEDKLVAVIHPDFAFFRQVGEINIYKTIRWSLESLSANYPAYKRIMGFVLTKEDLPRTRLGKLKRYAIQTKYLPELQGKSMVQEKEEPQYNNEDLQLLNSDIAKQTLAIIAQELSLKNPVSLFDHLELDLSLDSLRRVELMAGLEKKFAIHLDPTTMAQVLTVKELILVVEKTLHGVTSSATSVKSTFSWQNILHTQPAANITKQIALVPGFFARFVFTGFCATAHFLFKLGWRLKIVGSKNIPKNDNFVFCANHASFLDGFIFVAAIPNWLRSQIFLLGLSEFFESPLIQRLIKLTRVIPVDSAKNLLDAMQAAAYVLNNKKSIVIFPEGERSIDGQIKDFKNGVGILAKELNQQLLPVYINGSFAAWPRGQKYPKLKPLQIVFGKPCVVSDLLIIGKTLGEQDDYAAIAVAIRNKIMQLKKESIKNYGYTA